MMPSVPCLHILLERVREQGFLYPLCGSSAFEAILPGWTYSTA